jgi:glycosyltransferase involved in cell wall biosynthesis
VESSEARAVGSAPAGAWAEDVKARQMVAHRLSSRVLRSMRVSFLIPAYNESATILEVIEKIRALGLDSQIIVVDDGSRDDTAALVEGAFAGDPDAILLRKPNGGKGSALRHGIPLIDGDIAVIKDADLEYDPAEVPALIEPIEQGVADVVFGSRLSGGRPQRAYMFWHLVGNRFLSLLTGLLYNTTLSDMETGYKAFKADIFKSLDLHQDSFGIEPEITAQICRRRLRIYELPISYYGRTYEEGKNITWKDGLTAVRVLIEQRFKRGA